MVLDELAMRDWAPGASLNQALDGLLVAHIERIAFHQVLVTDCEHHEASRLERQEHVLERLRGEQVGAEGSGTRHDIELAAIGGR